MLTILVLSLAAVLEGREVAITIDDLPRGGDAPCDAAGIREVTRQLLKPFREQNVPLTGFVNEGRCLEELGENGMRELLTMWLDAGADLGNHTLRHADYHSSDAAAYQRQILEGERITKPLLEARGRKLRYFRHPFLRTGTTLEAKRGLEAFLARHGYRVAPVTLDNSDWMFAEVYTRALRKGGRQLARRVKEAYLPYMESIFEFFEKRSVEVAGHEIRQTLLLHVNQLNAECMPDLLAMMRRRGYRIVPLDRALEDPAYQLADEYAGPGGFSWIHRWSKTKGMPGKGEPEEPAFVRADYDKSRGR
jgi:peptidoglycan/xylan/chitin deacetylase (PgdA/CDA1 family)